MYTNISLALLTGIRYDEFPPESTQYSTNETEEHVRNTVERLSLSIALAGECFSGNVQYLKIIVLA